MEIFCITQFHFVVLQALPPKLLFAGKQTYHKTPLTNTLALPAKSVLFYTCILIKIIILNLSYKS